MAGSFIDGSDGDEVPDEIEVEEPVGGVTGCLQFVGLLLRLALLSGLLVIILWFVVALVTSI